MNQDAFPLQHWHGLFQSHTNYDDGPAFVTQCPIVPQESFLYDFKVPGQAVLLAAHIARPQPAYFVTISGDILVSQPLQEPVL